MYNHYTPQSDGSYRRSTVPENNRRPPAKPQPPKQEPQKQPAPPPCPQEPPCAEKPAPAPPKKEGNLLSFLRDLLPREIDGIDLMVILLLILMNREEDCDGISPLLTLALYFLL